MQTISNLATAIMSPTIPKTCKALVAESAGADLVLKDVPVKEPSAGEILVKTVACGVCHSDEAVRMGHFGPMVQFPVIPGHEIIGDVVAVPEGEKRWKVGDRVGGGWHGGHDGTCKQCNKGLFQMCRNGAVNGVSKDGGYSEYCILRSEATVRISPDLKATQVAPLLCAGVTLFNSIRHMNVSPGDTVAIQGLGGLGHLGVQYSRKMGFRTVALSSSEKKREFAEKLGANDYFDGGKKDHGEALQEIGGAALIVVTAPNPKIISGLLKGLAPLGKLLILAPVGEVPVDTLTLISNGASVHGWPSGHALDSEEAIQFAQYHDVNCMVEEFPLKDGNKALAHMNEGNVRFRGVLTF